MKIFFTSLGLMAIAGAAVASTYTVKSGDTMKTIADSNGITFETMRNMNTQIKNPDLIYPGQKLNLDEEVIAANQVSKATAKVSEEKAKVEEKAEKVKTEVKETVADKASCTGTACDNVINGNPMYRPAAGHFYSVTTLESDTSFKPYNLNEIFGFGITDRLSAFIDTSANTSDSFKDHTFGWEYFGGGLSARFLDNGNWKGDAYGQLRVFGGEDWWHQDSNGYNWTAGTKIGYSSCWWTLNGLFEYDYANSEAFNWDEESNIRSYRAGLEGQYVLNADWNIIAAVVYEMPEIFDNYFTGKLGVNYNISKDMYVGAYAAQSMDEDKGELADETTLGLQFGIDF